MKYNRNYRLSKICFAIALAPIIWIAAVSTVLLAWPSSLSALGLNIWSATTTLFFVPTIAGATLMIGLNHWLIAAQIKRLGLYKSTENAEKTTEDNLQKPL